MCGIAAVINLMGSPVNPSDLDRLVDVLNHRGPDGSGKKLVNERRIGIVHTRLAVNDIANGQQPMFDRESNCMISFNGEIYDCDRLRNELSRFGHKFETTSDTEVILALYKQYGYDMFDHMNGEFAFILWDGIKKELIVARDRFGIKPTFYYQTKNEVVFSSEVKGLFCLGRLKPEPCPEYLLSSFVGTFIDRGSFFKNVRSVKPGHFMVVKDNLISERCYWKPNYTDKTTLSYADSVERVRELLTQSIHRRMVSEREVAVSLSGGLDSSIIGAVASERNPDIRSFSIGFDGANFCESQISSQTAKELGISNHLMTYKQSDICDELIETVCATELPISTPQPIGMRMLSRTMRDAGVTSVMTGEGADEMFGGYAFFKLDMLREGLRKSTLSQSEYKTLLSRFMSKEKDSSVMLWYPCKSWQKHQVLGEYDSHFAVRSNDVRNLMNLMFTDSVRSHRLQSDYKQLNLFKRLQDEGVNGLDFNRSLSLRQLEQYIFSIQADRVIMNHSIEGRLPFLDKDLVDFVNSLPPSYLIDLERLQEKLILNQAFEKQLPKHMRFKQKRPYYSGYTWNDFIKNKKGRELWEHYTSPAEMKKYEVFNPLVGSNLIKICKLLPKGCSMHHKADFLSGSIFTANILMDNMMELYKEQRKLRFNPFRPEYVAA